MERNEIPKAGEFYKHFKNKLYQIVAVAEHTETGEKLVVYQALYGTFSIYARPLSMFMSEVDHEKYPEAEQKYRFTKVHIEVEEVQKKDQQKEGQESISEAPEQTNEAETLFYEFLNADTYKEKLEIFRNMRDKLDDRILTNIAVSMDLALEDDDLEKRYRIIQQNLETNARFECNRLR